MAVVQRGLDFVHTVAQHVRFASGLALQQEVPLLYDRVAIEPIRPASRRRTVVLASILTPPTCPQEPLFDTVALLQLAKPP